MVQAAAKNREEKRILPVFYHHLDPTKIPSNHAMDVEILPTDTVDTITRALLCVEGLYNLTTFPLGSHSDLWERVWPWAQFLDVHRSRIADAPTEDLLRARVFCIVVNGDHATTIGTPEIAILAAQVWGGYFREPNATSEMALRRLIVFFRSGNEYSLDQFIEGAGSIDALAILVVQLVHYLLKYGSVPQFAAGALGSVIIFLKRFKHNAWLSALQSHKFISAMISVLLFVEPHIEGSTEQRLYQGLYEQTWLNCFPLAALDSGYTGVVEAVNAGIIQLIASVVGRNLKWTEASILEMISFVQPATVYYPVLAAIERTLPLTHESTSMPAFSSSALYPAWQEFVCVVLHRLEIKTKFDSGEHIARRACDNLEVNMFQC